MHPHFVKKNLGNLELLEVPGEPGGVNIILFHGFGSDAFDLLSLSKICQKKPRPTWYFPRGPLEIPFSAHYVGRAWFPIDSDALHRALREKRYDEIDQAFPTELSTARMIGERLIGELDIPRSKLILGGFSQGAIFAVDLALHAPDRCAGLLILSGTIMHATGWKQLAHLHAQTPFFQSHGEQDAVLPFEKGIELEKLLIESGWKGKLHRFPGGHEIPHSILIQLHHFLDAY